MTYQLTFLLILLHFLPLGALQYFDKCELPFEKIYVSPNEIFCTPHGIFYESPTTGAWHHVTAALEDCAGLYVILVAYQCPKCDRYYEEKHPPKGYVCPLFEPRSRTCHCCH